MKKILVVLVALLIAGGAFADSLWNEQSISPYSTKKLFKPGDVITVLIVESTSAVQKAGTDTNNQDTLSLDFTNALNSESAASPTAKSFKGARANAYKGGGSTTRSSNVLAAVTVTVNNVLPNGNIVISGVHKVTVNEEVQEITVKGIVRPEDLSKWNTVYSYQVADSTVTIKGSGTVGEAQAPGLFMRLLNWIF